MNGAEEDGVDNRVEAPSRVPGEGPDKGPPEQKPDTDRTKAPAAEAADPETTRAPEAAYPGAAAGNASDTDHYQSAMRPPEADENGVWPSEASGWQSESSAWQSDTWQSDARTPGGHGPDAGLTDSPYSSDSRSDYPYANGPAPGASTNSGTHPMPSVMAPSQGGAPTGAAAAAAAVAAMAGAASGARGIASKLSSSFSGLTKSRPPRQAKSRPPSMPARQAPAYGGGLPPPRVQGSSRRSKASRSPQPPQARRAMLALERIEPMSVMKFSFLISLVGWVVLFVAVAVLYFALSKLGVFTSIEKTVGLVTYNKTHPGSNAASWFKASRVLEYTALVCTINAILFTALATVGAALYNLISNLTGGIEVTLKESD